MRTLEAIACKYWNSSSLMSVVMKAETEHREDGVHYINHKRNDEVYDNSVLDDEYLEENDHVNYKNHIERARNSATIVLTMCPLMRGNCGISMENNRTIYKSLI